MRALLSLIVLLPLAISLSCGKKVPGPSGADGGPCKATPLQAGGGYTLECPNSPPVTITDGFNGSAGPQGEPGAPGTSIEPVTLCPGYATTYPSVFAEVALCIAGSLYAVYWDSTNAWLTLIPPGRYRSTSSSAVCSFTVSAGCTVSP